MIKINFKKGREEPLQTTERIDAGCWIDVTKPTHEDIEELKKLEIPADHIKSALDEDERPRCERESGVSLIVFRVPVTNSEGPISKIETTPLSILITRDVIITISLRENDVISDFYNNKVKNFSTTKRTRFLIQILSRINHHFLKHLDMVERKTGEIEMGLLKSVKNEEIISLFGLQKTMVYFNAAVIGNGKVLDTIRKGRIVKLFEGDDDLLENLIIENEQSVEMVSVYNQILSNTLDAYASIVSNNLNVVMKFLASLTIIAAIPTMVASFYGMNIGLPLENEPLAFAFILAFAVFLSFLTAMIFIKKRWL